MRILVTGGAGFIGSHVVHHALASGHQVAVLDNFSTGRRDHVPAGVTVFTADLRDRDAVLNATGTFRPDVINHQAAQASVTVSVRDPLHDAHVNILGTLHLLDAARTHGVRRVVYASTGGAICGDIPEGQAAGEDWPAHPISPYAVSKFSAECYLQAAQATAGLACTSLRYANVYGPRQSPHGEAGVVAIFTQRVLAGLPLQVNAMHEEGDEGCVRDYVFVTDVARANLAACLGDVPEPHLHIGTGAGTTTVQLARAVMQAAGRQVPVYRAAPRTGDVQRSVLDAGRYRQHFGEPTALAAGLRETLAWFQAQAVAR